MLSPPTSHFQAPSIIYQALTTPIHLALSYIHTLLVLLRGSSAPSSRDAVRIVCISDTHTNTPNLPAGDVLIHAGDLTNAGTASDIQAQFDWLAALPFQYIVVIAGNHDSFFDAKSRATADKGKTIDFNRRTTESLLSLALPKYRPAAVMRWLFSTNEQMTPGRGLYPLTLTSW